MKRYSEKRKNEILTALLDEFCLADLVLLGFSPYNAMSTITALIKSGDAIIIQKAKCGEIAVYHKTETAPKYDANKTFVKKNWGHYRH
jgi:hypothetical protein